MKIKSTIKTIPAMLVCLTFLHTKSNATIFTVNVANFSFSVPNIPNVLVGDTIRWVWISGFHDTTCDSTLAPGTTRPAGAPAWSASLTSPGATFDYKVLVAGTYNYICSIHPVAMKASFTASSALPVKLSEFKVLNENNTATLKWITASEDNIDYFSIQKSNTGVDFAEIARVPAAGHSSVTRSYSYTDAAESTSDKYYYYTIAVVDKEGRKEYTAVELFKNKINISKIIISLSPNPVHRAGHLMLKFNADKESKMEVKITNMEGRSVMQTTMQAIEGVNNGHLMLNNLSAGAYSISFELNGVKEIQRLVIQ